MPAKYPSHRVAYPLFSKLMLNMKKAKQNSIDYMCYAITMLQSGSTAPADEIKNCIGAGNYTQFERLSQAKAPQQLENFIMQLAKNLDQDRDAECKAIFCYVLALTIKKTNDHDIY